MKDKLFSLKNRLALVTGSSRGIGRAIAETLAEAGAEVVAHGVREGATLPQGCRHFVPGDLSVSGGGREVATRALQALERGIDIVVLNASIQIRSPWLEITPEDSLRQMQANFFSSLEILQELAPGMQERQWGRILTVGSVQQRLPHKDMAVYAASKAAQMSLVSNLARQLAPDGITVNNLAPGVILTDRNTDVLANPDYEKTVRAAIPARYFGEAHDCAGAALLLCSEEGRYITGQDLYVSGGLGL